MCKDLGCDKLAGYAYGAVIDKGIAWWGGVGGRGRHATIKLHAKAAYLLTYLNSHSSCRCVPVSCKFFVHTQKACKVLLGSAWVHHTCYCSTVFSLPTGHDAVQLFSSIDVAVKPRVPNPTG